MRLTSPGPTRRWRAAPAPAWGPRRGRGGAPPVPRGAPGPGSLVRRLEARPGRVRDDEVALGVADEVFDDALRLRVGCLAEVGPEAVVGGEGDIARRGHDDVGDDAALEASHPLR